MRTRFDYVKYDEMSQSLQDSIKRQMFTIEAMLNNLPDGRAKSLALTKIEEAYMWCGKAIRDEQLKRNPESVTQEERTNS